MIFVDTSFFFAGLEPRDSWHAAAVEVKEKFTGSPLVTTNQIRGETWTLVRRKHGHYKAVAFLDAIEQSEAFRVANIDESIEREALNWLRIHDEREYSFTDATSFVFMRNNQITEALAFDGDFQAAGFTELRP